jgi:hypothetical protein
MLVDTSARRVWGTRMLWVVVCAFGLVLELAVIVVLGRHVTRRYEEEPPTTRLLPGPADTDRRAVPQRAA